jgi:transcriptional regulator with XRE-family HTH domain
MMPNKRIEQLQKEQRLPLRKLAAALDIDTASYCKIEKGERRARKEYIPVIAELLQADKKEFITIWIVDLIIEAIEGKKELAGKASNIAIKHIK